MRRTMRRRSRMMRVREGGDQDEAYTILAQHLHPFWPRNPGSIIWRRRSRAKPPLRNCLTPNA
eukprot:5752346-Pyramimonas_sp.AAC.1